MAWCKKKAAAVPAICHPPSASSSSSDQANTKCTWVQLLSKVIGGQLVVHWEQELTRFQCVSSSYTHPQLGTQHQPMESGLGKPRAPLFESGLHGTRPAGRASANRRVSTRPSSNLGGVASVLSLQTLPVQTSYMEDDKRSNWTALHCIYLLLLQKTTF
jgi:hypothetical protein